MLPRFVLPLLLALGAAGCFTWRPWEPAAPLGAGVKLPRRIRVTTDASRRMALNSPYLRGDSLLGRTNQGRDTIGFAVAEVRGLETERFHLWRTLGATVAAPAAAFLATYLIVCDGGSGCEAQPVD